MNANTLQLIGQILFLSLGPVLATHGIHLTNDDLDAFLGWAVAGIGALWKYLHFKAATGAPAASPVNITKVSLFIGLLILPFFMSGCVAIQPGNDPVVVRAEQVETVAKSTFDTVLNIENSQRSFFATNAPGFHNFCQWLRAPTVYEFTNDLPRASAMLMSLDDVKLAYKNASASSNDVFTALATVTAAMAQANAWLTVATNQP